jgi:hypothetical protein
MSEVLKQLQSLIAALLPFLSAKFQLLPFLNPQISKDLWPITALIAFLASMMAYNLKWPRASDIFAIFGLVMMIVSVGVMISVVAEVLFATEPILQDFSVRITYFSTFVGGGIVLGWCVSRLLDRLSTSRRRGKKATP